MAGVRVAVRPRARAPGGVTAFLAQQCGGLSNGLHVAAVAVDEHQPRRPAARRPAVLDAAEAAAQPCRSTPCPGIPRAHRWRRSRPRARASSPRRAARRRLWQRRWRFGCRCPTAGAAHVARSSRAGQSTRAPTRAAASSSSSRARWGRPPADGRPNSPGVRQLLVYALRLISDFFAQRPRSYHVSHARHVRTTRISGAALRRRSGALATGARREHERSRTAPGRRRRTGRGSTPCRGPSAPESMPPRRMSSTFSTPA